MTDLFIFLKTVFDDIAERRHVAWEYSKRKSLKNLMIETI